MNGNLFEYTKVASYFLWESTGCDRALDLWYCAEDIACYFEQMGILSESRVAALKQLGVYDSAYIHFMRHVAFRIYIYTNRSASEANWFAGEELINNSEWVTALVGMAAIYRSEKSNSDFLKGVRSENVRAYYNEGEK